MRVKRKAELIPTLSPVLCGGSDESPAPPPSPTSLSDCSDTEMGLNEPLLLCKSENKKKTDGKFFVFWDPEAEDRSSWDVQALPEAHCGCLLGKGHEIPLEMHPGCHNRSVTPSRSNVCDSPVAGNKPHMN